VRLGLPVPNYGPYSAIHAAEELGYFKKNGVAVEITSYRGGSAAQEALAAGQADMIISAPAGAALAIKKGVKQKIVGVLTTAPTGFHIVVLADSPIKSVKDLEGKNVAVTSAGSLTELYLMWAARNAGVKAKSVPVGAAGLIPTLKAKQVDAASMHSPLPASVIVTGEARSIFDVARDMPPAMPEAFVATLALIDAKPKAVEGVMRAIYQSIDHMKKSREEALRLISKHTGEKNEKVLALEYEAIRKMSESAKIEPKWLEAALELAKLGGATDLPAMDQIHTDKFSSVGTN
jgi:NitT/TauT family transport system substrate-binding protein